jgi:Flp pilus assembly pilin Flp
VIAAFRPATNHPALLQYTERAAAFPTTSEERVVLQAARFDNSGSHRKQVSAAPGCFRWCPTGLLKRTEGGESMISDFFRRLHINALTLREESGQTMAEYGVVLAVITIGVVVVLTSLAGGITNALNAVKSHLP